MPHGQPQDPTQPPAAPRQRPRGPGAPAAAILRWMDRAACAGAGPGIPAGATPDDADQAKALCADCPARAQRRDYALTTAQERGVRGRLSETQRRDLPGPGQEHPGIGGAA